AAAAAAASAFAIAASTAMSASTSSAVAATAALAAAAMASANGPNSSSSNNGNTSAFCSVPFARPTNAIPFMHTAGSISAAISQEPNSSNIQNINSTASNNSSSSNYSEYSRAGNNGFSDSRGMGASNSPLVAPRPVPAHQLAPPSWMLAALPLEVLLGLTTASFKPKIINDVFFTSEERCDSPRLTPVSDIDDTRVRPLVPGDEMESLDPSADLALFADDAQDSEVREVWGAAEDIETTSVCSTGTRQPSPTPTMTSESVMDEDLLLLPDTAVCGGRAASNKCQYRSPLSVHVAQSKAQYPS
ncbi:hypothetical protein IW150_007411, partial [Coemansia sp. RSA 2607]